LTRWKFIAGVFDRHSTRCDEAGIGFAEMEKLAARLSNAHGEFNGDYVNGEQQRLHRVRAEYSARLTAPDALDLDRADPCLVRGRCIEYRSANSYRYILRYTFRRLERKPPLSDHIPNVNSRHVSLCDR
jgi:hypothetical protein